MHLFVFSDSLLRSLLEEPIIDDVLAAAASAELDGLGAGEPAVVAGDAVDDVAKAAAA